MHPDKRKETNKLDHVVTDNINNKDQCNDTIEYEPKFDHRWRDTLKILLRRSRKWQQKEDHSLS